MTTRRPSKRPPAQSSPLPILLGVGGVVVVGIILAVVISQQHPPPVPVKEAPPPEPQGWGRVAAAKQRGLEAVSRARACGAADFEGKRRGYDEAAEAFQEALGAAGQCRSPSGDAGADEQERELRVMLAECHKIRPLGTGK